MSIISDDIWDKFGFEDNNVDSLLASFSTTHSMDEQLIKNETDDWMEDDLVTKMKFPSPDQLRGYDDASNAVCPDCMWNGNCVRKSRRSPNYKSADVKGRGNGLNAVRKLNFDGNENNDIKFNNPKIWMEQFDFGLAENDELPQIATKKRKKSFKNGHAIVTNKKRKSNPKQEKNNNVDLYCYEKLNEKSLLWNNGPKRNAGNEKLKSAAMVQEEISSNEQFLHKNKVDNNVESPRVHQSVKDFNFNDDQPNKTKLEIMNCYEILNLFDDKEKNQQIQVDTLNTASVNCLDVGAKSSRNSRKEKDLRNQRDRLRKQRLEQGYRELSQLVPELSLPQSKHLTVAQKREILQKTAQYCSYLVNRNLVLKKEKELETKKNFGLLDTFKFLSSG